ncbi:MAG: glycosyltransferase [Betaproteobacteria bacterium]|nr:glycosyltransferase [Betaproteobacteria bacterium]
MASTSFPADADDWRGRFIHDMAAAIGASGNVDLSLWAPPGTLPDHVASALGAGDAVWLKGLAESGGIAHLLRRRPLAGCLAGIRLVRRLNRACVDFAGSRRSTVAHVNWLQNALSLRGTGLPALITVLGSDLGLLRLPGMTALVRSALRGRRAILAPNAEWMLPELHRRFGDLAEVRAIPFGLHERWFAVERQPGASASGDWLMVSRVTRAKLGRLSDWGHALFGDGRRRLHLIGPAQESIDLPAWAIRHGPATPEVLAREWFPRVQGLLTLSTHDEGRPQVMMEAMAAGLPVVATDLPGHCDLVRDGQTGFLVRSVAEAETAMARLDDSALNMTMGAAARDWATAEIGSWPDTAGQYCRAYAELLGRP